MKYVCIKPIGMSSVGEPYLYSLGHVYTGDLYAKSKHGIPFEYYRVFDNYNSWLLFKVIPSGCTDIEREVESSGRYLLCDYFMLIDEYRQQQIDKII